MKTILFILLTALGLCLAPALPAEVPHHGTFAAGLRVGSLTGVDLKYWMGHDNAIQLALGSGLGESVVLQGSDIWHIYNVFHSDRADLESSLPLYFGIGGSITSGEVRPYGEVDAHASVLGIAGISYLFEREPFDLFLELEPTVRLYPYNSFVIQTALGGRFYF